jgi:hypothetical protein
MKTKVTRFLLFLVISSILMSCHQGNASKYSLTPPYTATVVTSIPMDQGSPSPAYSTETPTLIPSTVTTVPIISPTSDFSAPRLEGILYFWIYRFLEPLYTSIDLSENDLHPFLDDRNSPEPMVAGGRITIALAFAPYSPLIAYLTKTNDSVDLWLADLKLQQIEHLWSNDQQWLGALLTPGDAYIQWGPAEKSIILSSYLARDHIVIYSLKSKKVVESVGVCDRIAPLPDSDRLSVWCSFETGVSSPYGVLTYDGDILYSKYLPEDSIEIFDWSFAPDNHRIIFAPKEGNVTVEDNRGKRMVIPARLLDEPREYRTQPYLQWSKNGDRLLIYAFNKEYCPLWEDPGLGNLIEKECWLILDAKTGDFLWWPDVSNAGIHEATGIPLMQLASNCAGLSPESTWIAICFSSGAINDFLLISINNKQVIDIHSLDTLNFKWMEDQN